MGTKIKVIGQNQIGGCVVLISTGQSKICIDFGENLPGQQGKAKRAKINWNEEMVDAVFFTHYHGDHMGRFMEIPAHIPLYMGEAARQVRVNISRALHREDELAVLLERDRVRCLKAGYTVEMGDIRVTPYLVDHSAYDAYMFLIETPDKRILHTGDFRNHGYRGKALFDVIDKYIVCYGRRPVDILITEGTMMSRMGEKVCSEAEPLGKARELFKDHRYVFLICSSTNLDSLASFYHAAASYGMGMYGNSYVYSQLKTFRETAEKATPFYDFKYAYEARFDFVLPGLGMTQEEFMRKKGFVAVIKGEPGYEKWIERFGDLNPVVVYSMWEGYVEPGNEAFDKELYDFVEKYHGIYMHTSGHAPAEVIGEVIRRVCPREAVIPILDLCQYFGQKKSKDYSAFPSSSSSFCWGGYVTNRTMYSFSVIPALYVFKNCSARFPCILIGMQIDFFLFQHGMERLNAGIVIWIPLTAERMQDSLPAQIFFKHLACILASKVAVKDNPPLYP